MIFTIKNHLSDSSPDEVYLVNNDWDDWFEFETVYNVYYQNNHIGNIKIGKKGQTERRAYLPNSF